MAQHTLDGSAQASVTTAVSTGKALGADIQGIDLRSPLAAEQVARLEEAWSEHLVLRFRRQGGMSQQDLVRFSSYFGDLDARPVRGSQHGSSQEDVPPEINVISNVLVDGKPIGGLGSYEAVWHADMTYNERPPKGSCLYAIEIPPQGGATSFTNMYLAYETLPPELKDRIDGLRCIHDASRNSTGELRVGYKDVNDPRQTVGAIHPVVRVHPVTQRRCLLLGRRRGAYLQGLPLAESEALLDALWRHATHPSLTWTQVWELGDAILWDNRCTMHRRDAFDPGSRRIMYRTQIAGEVVV